MRPSAPRLEDKRKPIHSAKAARVATKTNPVRTATTTKASVALTAKPTPILVDRWESASELRQAARQWAERIGVSPARIQVRPMTTKWASRSRAGRLSLSEDLLDIPGDLGDFIIVYELVQLLDPQQGSIFKRFMRKYMPDWQRRARELRRIGDAARRAKRSRRHSGPDPMHEAAPAPPASAESAVPVVLVVDDDPALRRLVREIFTLEGRDVQEAPHGGIALEQLRAHSAGMVVLLGLMMPEVDGEAVLEALAADEALAARHSFVMVTAALPRAQDGRVAELLGQLNIPLVSKPFTVTQILSAVENASQQLD
jgi:CheY-like chemotaxis protein